MYFRQSIQPFGGGGINEYRRILRDGIYYMYFKAYKDIRIFLNKNLKRGTSLIFE